MIRQCTHAVLLAGILGASLMCAAPGKQQANSQTVSNDACLECHSTFRDEPIARDHARVGHLCVDCHGPSKEHMSGGKEKVKPDVVFRHDQVDAHCGQCHEPGHHPRRKMERFIEQYRGHPGPNGRTITSASICTDCHGRHLIPQPGGGGTVGCQCP